MSYTTEQQAILCHDPNRHACILAGPGTGKSSTVIQYIDSIRQNYPVKVIRLLTFTRAANGELTEKVVAAGRSRVESSTVHSFAISVLLRNPGTGGFPEPLRIADEWEWQELIKYDLASRLSIKQKLVETLKNEMSAQWESLVPFEDPCISANVRGRFMGVWEEHRRIYGYTLLSELPFRLKIALEGNPDLDVGHIDLLAVDEYQDLNACDLECLRLLSQRGVILFAIGDDDQSIYQFRKAHPAGIRNFSRDYSADRYPLSISHRCGRDILNWANFVISGDTSRPTKTPLTPGSDNPDGYTRLLVFNREISEAQGIAGIIQWLRDKRHVPLEEMLVLVRTAAIAIPIKETFADLGIPYSDPEEYLSSLRNDTARELIGFLRLMSNRNDSLAWWSLLKLTNGIGDAATSQIYRIAQSAGIQFGDALIREYETDFLNIVSGKRIISERVAHLVGALDAISIPESESWGEWIITKSYERAIPRVTQEIEVLLRKIDLWKDTAELTLGQYINQIEPLIKDISNSKIPGHLRIMTLSRSKGLTVRATIIAGVEDGIIPFPIADHQEERRLLYVGMTRSQEYLILTRCRRRAGRTARSGNINVAGIRRQSPFLDGGPITQIDGDNELRSLGVN